MPPSPQVPGPDPQIPRVPKPQLLMRAALVLVGLLLVIVGAWLLLSQEAGDTIPERVEHLFMVARQSPWSPLIVTALLVLLNVAGVPLLVLTAGITFVMGNVASGFAYAWTASMIGASVGFWLGHYSGGTLLRDFGGDKVNAVSRRLGRRGIMTSFLIRMVPTAPAIVVNMVIGASHIEFWKFFVGTALGIAPKLLMIAAVTKGLISLDQADWRWFTVGIIALVGLWLVTMWALRRYVERNGNGNGEDHS